MLVRLQLQDQLLLRYKKKIHSPPWCWFNVVTRWYRIVSEWIHLPYKLFTWWNTPQKCTGFDVIQLMVAEKKPRWILNRAAHSRVLLPTGQASTRCTLCIHPYPSHLHPTGNIALVVSENMTNAFYRKLLNVATVRKISQNVNSDGSSGCLQGT